MRLLVGQSWRTAVWHFFVYCWMAAVFFLIPDLRAALLMRFSTDPHWTRILFHHHHETRSLAQIMFKTFAVAAMYVATLSITCGRLSVSQRCRLSCRKRCGQLRSSWAKSAVLPHMRGHRAISLPEDTTQAHRSTGCPDPASGCTTGIVLDSCDVETLASLCFEEC